MIVTYRRCSTDEQLNGPKAQADAIERWLSNRTAGPDEIVIDLFDDGVSASIPLDKRPAGSEIMKRAKAGDTILVARLDRLFRSVSDAANSIENWEKAGITLVSISEGFDMKSPLGRAMCHLASVFAELERSLIRTRTRAALQAKKARGERVGAVPYGWDDADGLLVANSREQGVLAEIKSCHAAGLSFHQIAAKLNRDGVRAKKGGNWLAQSVRSVLNRTRA